MPGFFLFLDTSNRRLDLQLPNYGQLDTTGSDTGFVAYRSTNAKFLKDKVFFNSEEYFIVIEGVIFNKQELIAECKIAPDWENCILHLYQCYGKTFFKHFRGTFSGALYDKKNTELIVFTDHVGQKPVYYSEGDGLIVVSSELKWVVSARHSLGLKSSPSFFGCASMLTYGYMLENLTLVEEIKKLNAGKYLLWSGASAQINEYFRFSNNPDYSITKNDAVELLDEAFLKAVGRQFDKNLEYGYQQLNTLSGGLDSRMVIFGAKRLGYEGITNITWAESGSLDEFIAKTIANDLGCEWVFKSLNHGLFLLNLDEVVRIGEGMSLTYGLQHQYSAYKLLNFDNFGLIHTGQLGDVAFSSFYDKNMPHLKFEIGDGAYSKRLVHLLSDYNFNSDYENQEIFNFYNRCFTGANSGLIVPQYFSDTYSPFYDVDALSKALSIPLDIRFGHDLYFNWVKKKYPNAAGYKWEKTRNRITTKPVKIAGKKLFLNQIPTILRRKVQGAKYDLTEYARVRNMNPLDYYFATNDELRDFWSHYYIDHKELIPKELYENAKKLFEQGNTVEKNMVISLIAGLKLLFRDSR